MNNRKEIAINIYQGKWILDTCISMHTRAYSSKIIYAILRHFETLLCAIIPETRPDHA